MSTDTNYWLDPLDPSIVDSGTAYHDHNLYTHLGCVLLRCTIGILIIWSQTFGPQKSKVMWLILCAFVILFFLGKFIAYSAMDRVVWKVYLRTVLSYSIAGFSIYHNRYDHAGLLIIGDALMGLQSRHMAFISSYVNAQSKKVSTSASSAKAPAT